MLNMKKGLAIVLAAATALTFAPVSTLGLTGVVEAQAGAATITAQTEDAGTASAPTIDFGQDETATGDLATNPDDHFYFIKIDPDNAETYDYTVTRTSGTSVSQYANATLKAKSDSEFSLTKNDKAVVLGFNATHAGITVFTIVKTNHADKADTKKIKLTFTITGNVSTTPTFNVDGNNTNVATFYDNGSTHSSHTVKISFTNDGGSKLYWKVSDSSIIADASDASKTQDTVEFTPATATTPETGSVTLNLKTKAAGNPITLDVYDKNPGSDTTKKPLGSLKITVKNPEKDLSVADVPVGSRSAFTYVSPGSETPAVSFTDASGKPVTGLHAYVTDTTSAYSTTLSASMGENHFFVGADSTVTPGTYTVKVGTVSKNFKVVRGSGSGSSNPNSPAVAAGSAVFGGVTTHLYATDNTTYNLVNSDAEFELNNRKYTANQLKWYLTKAPTKTPENMGLTTGAGSIAASTTGKLNVTVSNAEQFAIDINGTNDSSTAADNAYIVGVYTSGADNTIVYSHPLLVEHADKGYVTKNYDAGTISTSVNAIATADPANQISDSFLNGVKFIGVNNKYLKGKDIDSLDFTKAIYNGTHFDATLAKGGNDDEVLKGSKLTAQADEVVRDGVYYETFYVPYTEKDTNGKFVAAITVKVSVSAGPVVEIKEGNFTYSLKEADKDSQALRDQKVIDLDLTTNKTFDIAAHAVSNKDNTSYAYDPDTQNVTVDAKGVVTAAKVGTAVVKVTPTANGVAGASVYVFFRVNKNANDQISVTGKDGDKATVLTTRQYNGNTSRLATEAGLASAQVGYVQVEVTGDETADVKENLTVKGNGTLSFSLPNEKDKDIASVDAKTGQITISHDYLNKHYKENGQPYAFPVKVVSTETASSALTTSYFYVVVDYADASITGLEDSYEVGTSLTETKSPSWLNLGLTEDEGVKHVSSNARPQDYNVHELTKDDDLDDSKLYDADDSSVFNRYHNSITRAIAAGKTEHVLVSASNVSQKIGHTYRVVTIKSVAGQTNYVTKIENVETGKTIYQQGAGVNSGASITISKPTKVKVTVAHTPDTSLVAKDDPAFTIGFGSDEFNNNMQNIFVAATENPTTYEVTLIPSIEGTQIIDLLPTQGRLSKTDYSLVGTEDLKVAVKYSTADSKTPAQVKGVKLGNKKGAKVVVKFTKDTTDKNIKYYVQKKVGKKTSGKSVGSNRTILSVKKGATVKVRVKAYYYDANGTKHVGKYSKWVTKKTDKK